MGEEVCEMRKKEERGMELIDGVYESCFFEWSFFIINLIEA